MGKAKNKNRSMSKADKVYAKKARNKIKKQNVQRTGAQHLLSKLAESGNKNRITGLKSTESRRSFRKRLAKFNADRLSSRKGGKSDDADADEKSDTSAVDKKASRDPSTALGPRNSSYASLVSEFEALQRRIGAGVPTHMKKFNGMLKMCAAIGEYHLAVFILGQMAAQEIKPDDESFDYLRLLQQKTPTNQTYIQGVDLGDALDGLHPKVVIKQLIQKRQIDEKWTELQPEVTKVRSWLTSNTAMINEGKCPNRFKLASLVASKCELSNRQARDIVAGLHKSNFVRQAKVQIEGQAAPSKIWIVKGVNSAVQAIREGREKAVHGKASKESPASKASEASRVAADNNGKEQDENSENERSNSSKKKLKKKKKQQKKNK